MNTIQKIIKTFFLTLFFSIVCICSTVFAASEPIGSINYPAPLKVGDDGLSYTYKGYHSSSGKVTKNLYLKLLELKIGEEAETYVKNKNSYCASSTSTSCWYLFKIRLYYFSSSETTPTDIEPYDIIDENSFYNAQKTQLKRPSISGLCQYSENYMKSIYPNSSTNSN